MNQIFQLQRAAHLRVFAGDRDHQADIGQKEGFKGPLAAPGDAFFPLAELGLITQRQPGLHLTAQFDFLLWGEQGIAAGVLHDPVNGVCSAHGCGLDAGEGDGVGLVLVFAGAVLIGGAAGLTPEKQGLHDAFIGIEAAVST